MFRKIISRNAPTDFDYEILIFIRSLELTSFCEISTNLQKRKKKFDFSLEGSHYWLSVNNELNSFKSYLTLSVFLTTFCQLRALLLHFEIIREQKKCRFIVLQNISN